MRLIFKSSDDAFDSKPQSIGNICVYPDSIHSSRNSSLEIGSRYVALVVSVLCLFDEQRRERERDVARQSFSSTTVGGLMLALCALWLFFSPPEFLPCSLRLNFQIRFYFLSIERNSLLRHRPLSLSFLFLIRKEQHLLSRQ
mmetsp:Transcript_52099/g.77801  ORF Transcript_52099/g.77801 Transcript_52099/m.77801 type:complete len:142 (+) Transcript_52099:550-975(+)